MHYICHSVCVCVLLNLCHRGSLMYSIYVDEYVKDFVNTQAGARQTGGSDCWNVWKLKVTNKHQTQDPCSVLYSFTHPY